MCIAPRILRDGTQVVCRECWQCRRARVDDIVGRCIAEMRTTPVGVHSVSLTYGRDRNETSVTYGEAEHERAVVLTYSDVQKLLKLLRFYDYPCRYLIVGEYGSRKGRAHWHAIFFWQKRVPKGLVLGENWRWARFDDVTGEQAKGRYGEPAEFWPHGHTFWQAASYESFRYNLKYVLKDLSYEEFDRQAKKGQSKMPPLGTPYFDGLARRFAEQGLAPQDGFYTFPEALRRNGERVQFRLGGRSEELFVLAYERWWRELHGKRHMPVSEYVETWLDKLYAGAPNLALQPYRPVQSMPDEAMRARLAAMIGQRVPDALPFDEARNSFYYTEPDGRRWYWQLVEGVYKWRNPELEKGHREFNARYQEALRQHRRRGLPATTPLDLSPRPLRNGLSRS